MELIELEGPEGPEDSEDILSNCDGKTIFLATRLNYSIDSKYDKIMIRFTDGSCLDISMQENGPPWIELLPAGWDAGRDLMAMYEKLKIAIRRAEIAESRLE